MILNTGANAQTWKQVLDSSIVSQRHLVLCISRDSVPDTVFNYISSKLASQDTVIMPSRYTIIIYTSDSLRRIALLDSLTGYQGINYIGNYYNIGESHFYISDGLSVILPNRTDSVGICTWLLGYGYKIEQTVGEKIYFSSYYALNQNSMSLFKVADSIAQLWSSDSVIVTPNFVYEGKQFADPEYGHQWGLFNNGQYDGTIDADGDVQESWDITNGCSDIKIAIIDDGIDLQHEDLSANLVQGYTAFPLESSLDPTYGYRDGDIGRDPFPNSENIYVTDTHGTECAGVIGAVKDNELGIVGVANGCKIMPVKVGISYWNVISKISINTGAFLAGVIWAVDHGADIFSVSIGLTKIKDDLIEHALLYANKYGRKGLGCPFVVSSGNNNKSDIEYFPGAYNYPSTPINIMVAGGSNQCDSRWQNSTCGYSNTGVGSDYGNKLDFVAPAQQIFTTDRMGSRARENLEYNNAGNYVLQSGTSYSAPYIAGIAALILSCQPTLTAVGVKKIIASTSEKVGGYTYSTSSDHPFGTWNNQMGYGRVNARAAVERAATLYFDEYLYLYGQLNYFAKKQIIAGDGVDPFAIYHGPVPIYLSATPDIDIVFHAGEEISLQPGFEVIGTSASNVNFAAYIDDDCAMYDGVFRINPSSGGSAKRFLPTVGQEYSLNKGATLSVFPNPVTSILNIHYGLPSVGFVQVDIVNLYGQSISVVANGEQVQGNHTVNFNTSDLASGVYFVQFRSQTGVVSKPVVVNR